MADIVFGFGSAHGPLLSTPPDKWDLRAEADKRNPAHPFRGEIYNFEELYKLREDENLAEQNVLEIRKERHGRCQKQIKVLSEKINDVDPDVILIVGDDQREWFKEDVQPTFAVYYGDQVDLVIGPDTGPTHMAWALNIPSITLFGPTPGYRNTYVTSVNKIIESNSEVDPNKIDKSDYSINNIKVNDISKLAQKLLEVSE